MSANFFTLYILAKVKKFVTGAECPPKNDAKPRTKTQIVKVSVTSETLHSNCFESGTLNTLQALIAPKAICRTTAATAIRD